MPGNPAMRYQNAGATIPSEKFSAVDFYCGAADTRLIQGLGIAADDFRYGHSCRR